MEFKVPSRALFGLRTLMLTTTNSDVVLYHNLLAYEPVRGKAPRRAAGVMIGEGGAPSRPTPLIVCTTVATSS
jgi:predicted membrane GTPase involved in stress response